MGSMPHKEVSMHLLGDLQYEVPYVKAVREVPEIRFVGVIGLNVNHAFDKLSSCLSHQRKNFNRSKLRITLCIMTVGGGSPSLWAACRTGCVDAPAR